MSNTMRTHPRIWIVDDGVRPDTLERLGEARPIADRLQVGVGALIVADDCPDADSLIAHGADEVILSKVTDVGINTLVTATRDVLVPLKPQLVLLPYERFGRTVAALLAATSDWKLISPGLSVQLQGDRVVAIVLDTTGRRARKIVLDPSESAIATFRSGVAEAVAADASRSGRFETVKGRDQAESIRIEERIPADPVQSDIRHLERLIAGGRGLGDRAGFDLLRRVADKLHAGIAASRMAVDLGWIEYDRQVGQTGKTVKPELYIACGISGASHHLDGMSDSRHIVAINTDKQAPIFRTAHLGLVADLHDLLDHLDRMLESE